MSRSAHVDTFARDSLPPREQWPNFLFDLPELQYPERLNCVSELLDRWAISRDGSRPCLIAPAEIWTYAELVERDRLADREPGEDRVRLRRIAIGAQIEAEIRVRVAAEWMQAELRRRARALARRTVPRASERVAAASCTHPGTGASDRGRDCGGRSPIAR